MKMVIFYSYVKLPEGNQRSPSHSGMVEKLIAGLGFRGAPEASRGGASELFLAFTKLGGNGQFEKKEVRFQHKHT